MGVVVCRPTAARLAARLLLLGCPLLNELQLAHQELPTLFGIPGHRLPFRRGHEVAVPRFVILIKHMLGLVETEARRNSPLRP